MGSQTTAWAVAEEVGESDIRRNMLSHRADTPLFDACSLRSILDRSQGLGEGIIRSFILQPCYAKHRPIQGHLNKLPSLGGSVVLWLLSVLYAATVTVKSPKRLF